VNFNETYALVIRFISLRIILHLAAINNWEIKQGDFISAFLNGILKEFLIYMAQPEGYEDPEFPGMVCLMLKSIYGLKQSARAWWQHLDDCLKRNRIDTYPSSPSPLDSLPPVPSRTR